MLNSNLDLTYYSKVLEIKRKDRESAYRITVTDILNKKEKQENTLLSNYRVGNWKTKEIFIYGVIGKKKIANKYISYVKGIPVELVNKLNLNKHDILRIRLKDDIIWLEKIDDTYNNKSIYITRLIRQNDDQTQLIVPSIIRNGRTSVNLEFLGDILPNVSISKISCISLSNKLIEKNNLTKDTDLLCTIQGNNLTVEKLINE